MDGIGGDESRPGGTRAGVKRRFDTMAQQDHTGETSDSDFLFYDPHYHNPEHPSSRPRTSLPGIEHLTIPGLQNPDATQRTSTIRSFATEPETIDLTRETLAWPRPRRPPATDQAQDSRAGRLPRFSRDDIIDISSGDEDEEEVVPLPPRSRRARPRVQHSRPSEEVSDSEQPSDDAFDRMIIDGTDIFADDSFMDASFWTDLSEQDTEAQPQRSRRRPRNQRNASTPAGANVVDLTDDDVEFIESRSLPNAGHDEPTRASNVQTRSAESGSPFPFSVGQFASMFRASTAQSRLLPRLTAHYNSANRAQDGATAASGVVFPHRRFDGSLTAAINVVNSVIPASVTHAMAQVPGFMDYNTAAFSLGGVRPQREPSVEYRSLPPPAEGFTRNPAPEEEVICPNCGDELAQGESETKRQVWVIKACGHAYCGECVNAKLQQTSKPRGSRKPPAPDLMPNGHPLLKKCVVADCPSKSVTKTSVVHVYMSE